MGLALGEVCVARSSAGFGLGYEAKREEINVAVDCVAVGFPAIRDRGTLMFENPSHQKLDQSLWMQIILGNFVSHFSSHDKFSWL